MLALTIRVPDEVANEMKNRAKKMHISRSEYVRKSIETMNKSFREEEKMAKLMKASKLVKENSMSINLEFSEVEDDPKA